MKSQEFNDSQVTGQSQDDYVGNHPLISLWFPCQYLIQMFANMPLTVHFPYPPPPNAQLKTIFSCPWVT